MSALAHVPAHVDMSSARGIAADELADLVRSFTGVTERLQATHVALESQVRQLTGELADANEQLRRSRELAALGEMAAGIAHEIRNPLGSIALDVEVLRDDAAVQNEHRTLCDRVLRAVGRLDQIVGDVLRFARDLRLQVGDVAVSDVFDAALESCEPLLRQHAVAVDRSDLALAVAMDQHLMVQALVNLVRNAVEAMAKTDGERTLHVSARKQRRALGDGRRADHVVLRVEDTGGGVPDGIMERIFHPFFTTRVEGTGLGLAIVHRIVDAHGGAMAVCNTERGARFEIALPVRTEDRVRARRRNDDDGLEAAVARRIDTRPRRQRDQGGHAQAGIRTAAPAAAR